MINAKLLSQTLEVIQNQANPAGTWNQGEWREVTDVEGRCGTSMCFAGWAAELAGGTWLVEQPELAFDEPDHIAYMKAEADDDPDHVLTVDGQDAIHVEHRAARVLGLNARDAVALFSGSNTLTRIGFLVRKHLSHP